MNDNNKPSYYDPVACAECYVDNDNEIHVCVPSDIWINAEQAENFAKGLMECAKWLRDNEQSGVNT